MVNARGLIENKVDLDITIVFINKIIITTRITLRAEFTIDNSKNAELVGGCVYECYVCGCLSVRGWDGQKVKLGPR